MFSRDPIRLLWLALAFVASGCLDQTPPPEGPAEPAPPAVDAVEPEDNAVESAPDPGVQPDPQPDPVEPPGPEPDPQPGPEPQPEPDPTGPIAHDEAADAVDGHGVDPHDGPVRVAYAIADVGDADWLRFELDAPAQVAVRVMAEDGGERCDGMATLALFAGDEPDPRAVLAAERPGHCPAMLPRVHRMMRALPAGVWRVRVADLGWQKQADGAPQNIVEIQVVDPLAEGEPCLADGELRACAVGLFCDILVDPPVCAPAGCGDGFLDPDAGEQCDDGNLDPDDGCSADCAVEAGGPAGVGGGCAADADCAAGAFCDVGACRAAACGDGAVDPGEECEGGEGCVECLADVDAARNAEPDDADAPYLLDVADGFDEVGFTLTPEGDVDWFVFELDAPAPVTIETRGFRGDGCEGDTVLELLDAGLGQIDRNDDRFDGQFRFCSMIEAPLAAGTYTVRANAFGDRQAGLNLLRVRVGDARAVGEPCDDLDPAALCAPGAGCGPDAVCEAARCGDGVVSPGERCDDGNDVDGDGCDACAPSPAAVGALCGAQAPCADGAACVGAEHGQPGVCVVVECGDGVVAGDEQCDDGNDVPGDGCDACGFEVENAEPDSADAPYLLDLADGSDAVVFALEAADADWFAFDLAAPARVEIMTYGALDADGCDGDTVLDLFDVAEGLDPSLVRDDDGGPGFCSRMAPDSDPTLDPLPAGSYLIRVTGFGSGSTGANVLSVRFIEPAPEVGEGCDALDPLLACAGDAVCGDDGICRLAVCGDGVTEGPEQCDDGNADDEDGCTAACAFGRVAVGLPCFFAERPGWVECVEGAYCDIAGGVDGAVCTAHVCGDGLTGPGEECDPGPDGAPGCADDCTRVPLAEGEPCAGHGLDCGPGLACDLGDRVCVADVCGNGVVGADEQCDDGNLEGGDGCDAVCAFEPRAAVAGAGEYVGGFEEGGADRFPLAVAGVGVATFETTGPGGECPGDTVLRVFDADGALVAEDDDGGAGLCSQVALDVIPGDYTVEVTGWRGRAIPNYILRVTLDPQDPDQPL